MKVQLLVVVGIGMLLVADDDAVTAEKKLLKGVWSLVSVEREGALVVDKDQLDEIPAKIIFDGDNIIVSLKDKQEKVAYKVDPAKKPKEIDVTPPNENEKTMHGIYVLEGDSLKICVSEPGQARPRALATKDTSATLVVFKRGKL